jgi:hypothetical protein
MRKIASLTALCLATVGGPVWGGQQPAESPEEHAKQALTAGRADDLDQLREKIAQQQDEIKRLEQAVQQQQELLERSIAAAQAASSASAVTADGTPALETHNVGRPNLIPAVDHGPSAYQHETTNPKPSPLSITLGNTTLTPLGFMDMTFFARSSNVGSGIGTNFAGIPYNTSATDHLSEMNFSAQNSRIGFRVDSTVFGAKVLGYLEADFLFNNNANSFQVTSNSAGLRLRNYFVDVQENGFEVLGGQDWSLLTPNRKGLSPLPSDIFYTQNMDTNYQVGLTWTRAPQFRFIGHPSENFAFGVSLENPQQYIGGGSGAGSVTLPSNLNTALASEFNSAQSATAIPNLFPDIIFKAAYDAHPGDKLLHFEAAGLVDSFKDYVAVRKAPAQFGTHSNVGYGGEYDMNLEVVKNFRLIENFYASDGGGRFIFGIAPDAAVQPSGVITPLHSYSSLDGFEAQFSPKTLIAMYYGGAYVGRDVIFDPAGSSIHKPVFVGYGFPGSSNSNNRYVQELTADWVQTFWKSPSYGSLSLINQYSYLFREPWYVGSGPRQTHTNMVYVDLRYTLP